jgi:acyl-[acyl-carrier-protein] desaturase
VTVALPYEKSCVPDRHRVHALLRQLEPVAERLLDRHQSMANSVDAHEYVPWGLGRDFDTEPWTPDQPRLTR